MKLLKSSAFVKTLFLVVALTGIILATSDVVRFTGAPADEGIAEEVSSSFIVQGRNVESVKSLVNEVGGEVTHSLPIINAVGARLTPGQLMTVRQSETVTRIYENRSVASVSSTNDPACACGDAQLEIDGNKVRWYISNFSGDTLTVESISITWPAGNDILKKVKLDGDEIFDGERTLPFTTINENWKGEYEDRQIHTGGDECLEFEFDHDAGIWQDQYVIVVEFEGGCTTEFISDGADPSDSKDRDTIYPTLVGADQLHLGGIDGYGVTVAVVDTGLWEDGKGLEKNTIDEERILAYYDAIEDEIEDGSPEDGCGHGTFVTSVIASSRKTRRNNEWPGIYNGIAPNVDLVSVKAFDEQGLGTYLDVIRGLDFVVQNKDYFGIRVLNLSFNAPVVSYYWDDPLNQAVMAAWQAGIVVVAAAGNTGPDPMTIGVPGNVPYVITVGAMSDSNTPEFSMDDRLATFSSVGPTVEGFVKPEVLAPGGHLLGVMDKDDEIPERHPEFHDGDEFFIMSGTSQAAAVVSGVVALMIQVDPELTPDQVKSRLMATARPAVDEDGALEYSVFQQGAGMVNAYDAVFSTVTECSNQGLDVDLDLAGEVHFGGYANRDDDGAYYIMGLDGYSWSSGYMWSDGLSWSSGYMWSDGMSWSSGYMWSDNTVGGSGYMWSDSYAFGSGYMWSDGLGETMSINVWVPQE